MKSIDEFATDYAQDKYMPVQTYNAVMVGANYVLDHLSMTISVSENGHLRDNLRKMIEQLKNK